jgi:hypothetical protein
VRTLIEKLPAFVSGALASAIAFLLLAPLSAQVKKQVIVACADAEGTMRLNDPPGPCRPGERRLVLKTPEIEDPKKDEPVPDKKVAELDTRLKDLEEKSLRGRMLGSRVVAPFEVVDEAGKRVFYVDVGTVQSYNATGTMVARIVANENGGFFEGRSATAKVSAAIGASQAQVGVVIEEDGHRRVNLGRNDKGNYGVRVYSASDKLVAGLGQSQAGTGIAMVADADGNPKAQMYSMPERGGIIEVLNGKGIGVATLSAAGHGGAGLMQVTNASGTVMVEAGVLPTGIGVVRAGPAGFNSGVGFVGLPASFISGKPGS